MNKNEVEKFIKIQSQMEEMHNEISILSKKSKDDALSEFKLSFVNNLLEEANGILNLKTLNYLIKIKCQRIVMW